MYCEVEAGSTAAEGRSEKVGTETGARTRRERPTDRAKSDTREERVAGEVDLN